MVNVVNAERVSVQYGTGSCWNERGSAPPAGDVTASSVGTAPGFPTLLLERDPWS